MAESKDSNAREYFARVQGSVMGLEAFMTHLAAEMALSANEPLELVRSWKAGIEHVLREVEYDGDPKDIAVARAQAESELAALQRALESLVKFRLQLKQLPPQGSAD